MEIIGKDDCMYSQQQVELFQEMLSKYEENNEETDVMVELIRNLWNWADEQIEC